MKDVTTYNDITLLLKVAKKEVEMSPVDFMKELKSYRNVEPEIWCVIGNLGCGKTFLAKRTALNLSNSQLVGILYTISIPCRNTDWHAMESTLNDPKAKVDSEFIQNWLCLGLQKGTEWSTDLSKHITVSSGEGLLLIIDGLDQFTKKVPFEKTFMFLLLKRTFLSKSTIILTCRPGAWIDISSHHELKIQRYYKVLGFSPENRDNYFEKQIGNGNKLVECRRILDRYYEINELSLIPVNASLFVSLLKGENSQSINTLTNLCTELTLYLIRRELSRMGLEAFSEVTNISQFYQDILECLSKIGLISYIGVAKQDPIFEERVPLFIDDIEYTSNCLGLIHEHYKEETNASIQKVWTFVNLTLQEFIAALWQSNTHWTDQCLSARFISHSNENFYLFKKVLRFLCGMLVDKSAAILTVLFYSFYRTEPKEMIDLPMTYQLKYEDLFSHTRYWNEFTEFYSALTEILFETNSHSISNWFKHFKQYLPYHLYIYILQTVSPNGWICFIQSLKIISQLELIHIDTEYIKQTQFEYLLENISLISVSYLSLVYKCKDSTVVLADLNLLREKIMKPEMKISIQLVGCDLKNVTEAIPFFPSVNHGLSCMRILNNINSKEFLLQLSQQLSGFHYLNFNEFKTNYDTLVPALCRATQLRGLQLYRIPAKYNKYLIAVLPQFTLLEEIRFDSYSLLPPICKLSNLRVLQIEERSQRSFTHIYYHLQQLMNRENNPLQVLVLYSLDKMSFSLFLECINKCTNLVQLKLCHYSIPLEDVVNFSFVNMLKSLVELIFFQVILYDQGFQALCNELTFHPTIRHFSAEYCAQTSLSCDPLIQLIYTLPNLETLHMTNLDEPDGEPIELLKKKCSGYSIECRFY